MIGISLESLDPRHLVKVHRARLGPWILNALNRSHYDRLPPSDLQSCKTSDTLFIFGSGWSLNEMCTAEWEHIEDHDTLGFNWFVRQDYVRMDFHLIKEVVRDDFDPSFWRPEIRKYARLIRENPQYEDTTFLVQGGYEAINGNRLVGMRLLPEGAPLFRFRVQGRDSRVPPAESLSSPLVQGPATLMACVNFGYAMGYEVIVLAGVDLYDRRYFWLDYDEPRVDDVERGASHTETNRRADPVTEFIPYWLPHLRAAGVDLTVYNPKSLLSDVIPVYEAPVDEGLTAGETERIPIEEES